MDRNEQQCHNCRTRPALRRYCRACSPKASALYKRAERRAAKAAGEPYWLEWWAKTYGDAAPLKRREYQREYMRGYRRSRRVGRAA
jgi:hypothetical protein